MDKDVVIKIDNVSKKFTRSIKRSMFYGSTDIFKSMFGIKPDTTKLRKGEFWSLNDVSFELKQGEGLAIIGHNGSGKSTLLRLINGIFPPDEGSIRVKGKIGALIAVGAGFHPHMTGRENIYLSGTILGMSRNEIKNIFDEIIDFADIGDFIDAPVSTYSSGMSIRLGFSIAIHSRPDILLADEVLAVGDLAFALKCHKKISDFRKNGGTLILVSHSMNQVRNACEHALWLDKGMIKESGPVNEVCDKFENFMFKKDSDDKSSSSVGTHITNDSNTIITRVEFFNDKDEQTTAFDSGSFFKARIFYKCNRSVKSPIFTFGIANVENVSVVASYSNYTLDLSDTEISGEGYIEVIIPNLYLRAGNYRCTTTLAEGDVETVLDWHEKNFLFTINANKKLTHGIAQIPVEWKI
ncbi:Teichoic acids export ATP-binding protein TagH [Patescibacteria group bacterium]|nr:ABC transporter ATP-binding protein [Candidatus Dojkabacteria bacterium]CAG1023234.1 Teichoic acids export ATP-binding protein TagH [Patescibacteria group bacterium]